MFKKLNTHRPTEFFYSRMCEHVYSHDVDLASQLRKRLGDLCLYPTRFISDEFAQQANERASLHDLVERLDAADLTAAYNAVRLLALVPRQESVFAYIQAQDASVLARMGIM